MKLPELRLFLTARLHSVYRRSNSSTWSDVELILKNHPVWKDRLIDVIGLRIRKSRLNHAIQVQLLTNKKWFTIAWRQCVPITCHRDKKPIEEKQLIGAMRQAIRSQITRWRQQQQQEKKCSHCQSTAFLQVDHKDVPFSLLQQQFMSNTSLPVPSVFTFVSCLPKLTATDQVFKRHWQKYHHDHATYQWLCKTCNIQKSDSVGEAGVAESSVTESNVAV